MRNRWLAVVLAVASLAFFGYWSVFFAAWAGFTVAPPGWGRAIESIPGLLASVICGLIAIAAFRWILRWPVRSWWLLLAAPWPMWQFFAAAFA
ncbi:hypothetical protein [Nonomuraea dietziae]|uniref:hypothetical protein n=1 Tax=Nonomuraea dietziae TaxID=65515 RepID=UPI00343ECAD6